MLFMLLFTWHKSFWSKNCCPLDSINPACLCIELAAMVQQNMMTHQFEVDQVGRIEGVPRWAKMRILQSSICALWTWPWRPSVTMCNLCAFACLLLCSAALDFSIWVTSVLEQVCQVKVDSQMDHFASDSSQDLIVIQVWVPEQMCILKETCKIKAEHMSGNTRSEFQRRILSPCSLCVSVDKWQQWWMQLIEMSHRAINLANETGILVKQINTHREKCRWV